MSGLTIHGAHGGDVWFERDGDMYALTAFELAAMRRSAAAFGFAGRWGIEFDESDVTALIAALTGPQLWDCACGGPALVNVDGRELCPGCAAGYGHAENECEDAR